MTVNLSALAGAGQQFFNNSGVPLSGGKLYSYAAGTTTPQATYTSASGVTPLANPIILDSAGRVPTGEIWVTAGSNYKFVLKTSTDTTLVTWDNITGINGTGIATNASLVSYNPAGTGAVTTTVQAKLRQIVSVKDFGAVGDGVTDDTTAIQLAATAIPNNTELTFPGKFLVTSTVTFNAKTNIALSGGTIVTSSNVNPLLFTSCNTVEVSLNFNGPVNSQQYETVYNNSSSPTIDSAFNSGTWTLTELTTNTAASTNVTASKVGTTVTIALTADAGLTINRGVLSTGLALNSALRYVPFVNQTAFATGTASAALRFYVDGTEFNPQFSTAYNYMSGSSMQMKVGTGRFSQAATYSTITGYTGASYDIAKITICKLVNESATFNFASTNPNAFLYFSGCTNVIVNNCTMLNGYGTMQFVNCNLINVLNNTIKQAFQGISINTSNDVYVHDNYIDMRWLQEGGYYLDSVFFRSKGILGTCGNTSNWTIHNNVIYGSCWGMEFTSSTSVYGMSICGNKVYSPRFGISTNNLQFATIADNYCLSNDAFVTGFIETADNSSNIDVINNTCIAQNPCGQTCTAMGPSGSNYNYIGNTIRSPIGIVKTYASSPLTGIVIKGNKINFSNTALFIRDVYARIEDNDFSTYTDGYVDGITYSPQSMAGLMVQFVSNDSGAYPVVIDNNYIEGNLTYIAGVSNLVMDFTNNYIVQKYNPTYGLYGSFYASATSAVKHTIQNNRLYSSVYDPRSNGFIVQSAVPAGGTCVTLNQNASLNITSYSGTGTVTVSDGNFGGGAVTWNPGVISDGTFAETTVAGVYGAFNCSYSVAPPYSTQGCIVYAYYDGTNTKIRIQNETGASVTFVSGSWKAMAVRSIY
jgi:hypothetical protein